MDDRVRNLGERLEDFARQRARDELAAAMREPWAAFTASFTEHLAKNAGGPATLAAISRALPETFDSLFALAAPAVEGAAINRMADSIIRVATEHGAAGGA